MPLHGFVGKVMGDGSWALMAVVAAITPVESYQELGTYMVVAGFGIQLATVLAHALTR
jgi:hypothetical protein